MAIHSHYKPKAKTEGNEEEFDRYPAGLEHFLAENQVNEMGGKESLDAYNQGM